MSVTLETSQVATGPYTEFVQSPTPMAVASSELVEKNAVVGAIVGTGEGTALGAFVGGAGHA